MHFRAYPVGKHRLFRAVSIFRKSRRGGLNWLRGQDLNLRPSGTGWAKEIKYLECNFRQARQSQNMFEHVLTSIDKKSRGCRFMHLLVSLCQILQRLSANTQQAQRYLLHLCELAIPCRNCPIGAMSSTSKFSVFRLCSRCRYLALWVTTIQAPTLGWASA